MDVSKQLEHDHTNLNSLGKDILQSGEGPGVGDRDNQFDLYDMQVRRHLAVVEDVFIRPAKKGDNSTAAADLMVEHKMLRSHLSDLDRADKGSHEWTAEFRHFLDHFQRACQQHERLVQADTRPDLAREYAEAKQSRMSSRFSWNKVGIGVAGAAAVAGAALAANYFRSGRRRAGRSHDDFELRLDTDENLRLISSTKVEGTAVVGRDGKSLGTIANFMVDKYTGRVAYAVMKIKGSSGLFPLPWPLLDYDTQKDGYALDITAEEFANAPSFQENDEPEFDVEYRRSIMLFYSPRDIGGSTTGGTGTGSGSAMNFGSTGGTDRSNSSEAPSMVNTPAAS